MSNRHQRPNIHSTVAEIEAYLIDNQYLHPDDYMRDGHFRGHVANQIGSLQEALELADRLEAECRFNCAKARYIRSYLDEPFWQEGDRYRSVLSFARRIHCWSHEKGSFAFGGH